MTDRARAIVERAIAFPQDRREAFLEGACGGDSALRREVESLLSGATPFVADDQPTAMSGGSVAGSQGAGSQAAGDGSVLDAASGAGSGAGPNAGSGLGSTPGAIHGPSSASAHGEGPGSVIGRYRILQQIGEGGFGSVFMAEQKEPVRRRVALKIIKLGMDTRQVIARFEAERQALAMMDHPNIARVLDAGATEAGRPYFVMELVKGVPITEYCDRNGLTVRERLELMGPICHAIQHAHQKGIIHRDLKPSNVLVTLHDGTPMPKVIDFGIAKATSTDLTEKTVFTEYRQFIGTPEYMSPEQAEMSGLDIDTRTDVYSLGVLMYVLITGATPLDPQTLRSRSHAELQRLIVEQDAPRPSTRLSTLGASLGQVARHRRTEPGRLLALLRGELDWIVLKAMEKDRTRRYDTARDLADDIRRHLDNQPVLAAPPSRTYRLRKLLRRHRAAASTIVAVAAALVLAVIGTSWGLVRALSAEGAARAAAVGEATQRRAAEENERRAIAAAALASSEAARALDAERAAQARASELEAVTAFQTSMIQTIDVARMGERMREDVLAEIRSSMERQEMQAEAIVARMSQAEEILARANFSNPAIRGIEGTMLARAARQIDEQFADRPLLQARLLQSVAETRSVLGFGQEAEADFRRVAALRQEHLGADDPQSIVSTALVAASILARGDWPRAREVYREALDRAGVALGSDHPLARVLGYLVVGGNVDALFRRGDPEEVFWWSEITPGVSRAEAELAARSIPRIFAILDGLGVGPGADPASIDDAALDAIMDAFDEVFASMRDALGDGNSLLVGFKGNVGRNARAMGRASRGEPYLREAFEAQRRMLGDAHPTTVITMLEYSRTLFDLGRLDDSHALARQGLAAVRRVHGDEHPLIIQVQDVMIRNLVGVGQDAEAAELLRDVMRTQRRTLATNLPALASAFAGRSLELLERAGPQTLSLVDEMLAESLVLREASMPESWLTANTRSMLGEARLRAVVQELGDDPFRRRPGAGGHWSEDEVHGDVDRPEQGAAPPPLRRLLTESEERRLVEARSLLLSGFEALDATDSGESLNFLPMRRRQAAERLVRFFEAMGVLAPEGGHQVQVERWRGRVEELRQAERGAGEG